MSSTHPDPTLRGVQGPWTLNCSYCCWSTSDIGWHFEKNTNLHNQVARLNLDGSGESGFIKHSETPIEPVNEGSGEPASTFSKLRSFYKMQLSSSGNADPLSTPSGSYNYTSPASIARIVSIYTGRGHWGKKESTKSEQMREASDFGEGLRILDENTEQERIERLRGDGWKGTTSLAQRTEQLHSPLFTHQVRPQQPLLRTKRSKRCRTCRHILVKPEPKVQSTRFRIKLVALNYIPTVFLKPLQPDPSTQEPVIDLKSLSPLRPCQFLVTLKNPLFDAVKVTLATPAVTPGAHQHKVTILCPDLEIGPNIDQCDEALNASNDRRRSKLLSPTKPEYAGIGGKVAEAGKVWDKGRNWTTVVMEVVCMDVYKSRELEDLAVDEDLLEIPLYVRIVWESEVQSEENNASKGEAKKEKKELAYWAVLGVGRIARLGGCAEDALSNPSS